MKKTSSVLIGLAMLLLCNSSSVQGQSFEKGQTLYDKWHGFLDTNPILTEPMWFLTDFEPLLTDVLSEIESNKFSMAVFMCEKLADTNYAGNLYRDSALLEHVAGINLWFPENPTNDLALELQVNLKRFREQWKLGDYKNPSKEVSAICEKLRAKENAGLINPRDLVALRRYGVFGIPELIRQIRASNSKHAFAAFLAIVKENDQFRDYLKRSNTMLPDVQNKLDHVKLKAENWKGKNIGKQALFEEIQSALKQ